MKHSLLSLAALATAAIVLPSAHAELIYGIRETNTGLVSFDSAAPATLTDIGAISGIVAGQTLKGIDFRPATGELYAVSTNGAAAQLYTINLATAVATAVGSGFTLTGNTSTRVSIDFNPVVDRLRVVTGSGLNYRINPITGAVVAPDTNLAFDAADVNAGSSPLIADVAYTNNVAGATSTTLYGWNYALDNLVTIGSVGGAPISPNAGTMFSVNAGGTFVSSSAGIGFDISGTTGIGYLNADTSASTNNILYSVNLATGGLTNLGNFGADILDISVRITPPVVVPEPGTFALAGIGLAFGAIRLRRRKSA